MCSKSIHYKSYLFFNPLPLGGGAIASTPDRRCLLVGGGIVIPLPNELSIVRFLPPFWWLVVKLSWFTPPVPTKPDLVAKPSCLIRPAAHSRALDRALDSSVLRLLILILLQLTTTNYKQTNFYLLPFSLFLHPLSLLHSHNDERLIAKLSLHLLILVATVTYARR